MPALKNFLARKAPPEEEEVEIPSSPDNYPPSPQLPDDRDKVEEPKAAPTNSQTQPKPKSQTQPLSESTEVNDPSECEEVCELTASIIDLAAVGFQRLLEKNLMLNGNLGNMKVTFSFVKKMQKIENNE